MCKASKTNLKLNITISILFNFKLGLGHFSVLKAISWLGIFPWMQIRSYQTWAVQTALHHLWDKQLKTGAWDSARSPIWPCRLEVTGVREQEAPVSSLQSTVQSGWGCPSCGFCWQMWQRCCSPGRTHLTLAASGENVDVFLEEKVLIALQHVQLLLSGTIWSWASHRWRERLRYVRLRTRPPLTDWWAHCYTWGVFHH